MSKASDNSPPFSARQRRFSAGERNTPLRAGKLIEAAEQAAQIAIDAGGDCVRADDRRAA